MSYKEKGHTDIKGERPAKQLLWSSMQGKGIHNWTPVKMDTREGTLTLIYSNRAAGLMAMYVMMMATTLFCKSMSTELTKMGVDVSNLG